jgi:DNA invertase Pin-like site-specific DNA recombinase
MTGQKVGYIRVSSADQCTDRQLEGIELEKVFIDKASGKDANRPQLQEMLRFVREGDRIFVHSIDRLARNLVDLRKVIEELQYRKVVIEFVKEKITTDDNSPMASFFLNVMAAFAEMERNLIRERQAEGIAAAKARGAYTGRKKALTTEQAAELRELVQKGVPKSKVARQFRITRETVYQYLKQDQHGK